MGRKRLTNKYVKISAFFVLFSILQICNLSDAAASASPILYLFWGDGCPHCEKEKEFLKVLHEKYPELEIRMFEVWKHKDFTQLADAMRQAYDVKTSSVPITFLGKWATTGYRDDTTTGSEIEEQVKACIQSGCLDALAMVGPRRIVVKIRDEVAKNQSKDWERLAATASPRNATNPSSTSKPPTDGASDYINIWGKKIRVSQTGLPIFTLIIAGLDGFNPCAMWVLTFLLTLVIYAQSRKKILLIGGIFVIASGVIYFLFMTAWLNLYLIVGYVTYLRIAVALVAIVMGFINLKDFFFFKQGFSLTIPESAQPKLFKQMRDIIHTSAIPAVILGTIVLAVTANLIELLCTAGFPAIYTRILTLQKLPMSQYYLYLVFYNVVYVIPLAVIVSVFAWKMGGRKLTEKEGRILKLVGGGLMLMLGIILLVKPELLAFS